MTSVIYIGMDVHKNTYSLCAIDETGTVLAEDKIDAQAALIQKFVSKLMSEYGDDVAVLTGYEAGGLGYSLYNQLAALEIDCEIMVLNGVFYPPKFKQKRQIKPVNSKLTSVII
jgi:hypothetical protein